MTCKPGSVLEKDDYDNLPESVKQYYSRKEWSWLSAAEKANLVRTETEPDFFED